MEPGDTLGLDSDNRVPELADGISPGEVAALFPDRLNSLLGLPKGSSGLKLLLQAAQPLKWH